MKERLGWSIQEIQRYQFWKLRDLVQVVYFNSPFYRRFYDEHSFNPDNLRQIEDLKRLPILEKGQISETDPLNFVTVKSPSPAKKIDWVEEYTSGSTGRPLKIIRTWRDLYYIKAKIIRAFGQTGFRFYHRQAVLKSSAESLTGKHWFEKLGILRKYWLSVMDPAAENLKKLTDIRPHHVHGYPSGLLSIVEELQKRGQTFKIPIVCTGAEVLDQTTRLRIAESFKAEVFDLYGTREVGNVAWECKVHQGMHINDDAMILELLDENGEEVPDGAEGEVVVTYLDGWDFPFIRYRLGDRAVRMDSSCSCGVAFRRLEHVTGRSDERIHLPSGEWISGLVFQELRTIPWLSAFRVIQEDLRCVTLQVVPKSILKSAQLIQLLEKARKLLRGELDVVPEVLDRLPHDRSGKVQAIVCRLPRVQNDTESELSTEGT